MHAGCPEPQRLVDSKLYWSSHIAETSEEGIKHQTLPKRLSATKWGATQDVLTTVYKTYVRPALDYGCETGIEPLDSRRDKFTLKIWEDARRVDYRYWNEYRYATQRLNVQASPLSYAELLMKKHQLPLLMTPRATVLLHSRFCPSI
ncbi:hypothetical protein TNCV_2687661 [Trichonephila clavipes]|nr:hypothetical protein TNCV_2687661 [Trichonephila clavipes]